MQWALLLLGVLPSVLCQVDLDDLQCHDYDGYQASCDSINPEAALARSRMPHPPPAGKAIYPPLPRISVEELELPVNSDYKQRKKAFILTGAMEDWPLFEKWRIDTGRPVGEHYLVKKFGREVCDFYPYNMLQNGHPYLIRFGAGLQEVLHPPGRYRDGRDSPYLCQEGCRYIHMQLTPKNWKALETAGDIPKERHKHLKGDNWWMRRCLKKGSVREEYHLKTHWKIILIGTPGSGMFNHTDSLMTSSWHGHVQGDKWWFVCGKEDGVHKCYENVLHPGEVLFYGTKYWHETRNLDSPSMTVTGTVITPSNYLQVADKLHSECARGDMSFDFSGALCDALDACYPLWHEFLSGQKAARSRWRPWREVSSAENIRKKDSMKPTENNYDGRNYIAE